MSPFSTRRAALIVAVGLAPFVVQMARSEYPPFTIMTLVAVTWIALTAGRDRADRVPWIAAVAALWFILTTTGPNRPALALLSFASIGTWWAVTEDRAVNRPQPWWLTAMAVATVAVGEPSTLAMALAATAIAAAMAWPAARKSWRPAVLTGGVAAVVLVTGVSVGLRWYYDTASGHNQVVELVIAAMVSWIGAALVGIRPDSRSSPELIGVLRACLALAGLCLLACDGLDPAAGALWVGAVLIAAAGSSAVRRTWSRPGFATRVAIVAVLAVLPVAVHLHRFVYLSRDALALLAITALVPLAVSAASPLLAAPVALLAAVTFGLATDLTIGMRIAAVLLAGEALAGWCVGLVPATPRLAAKPTAAVSALAILACAATLLVLRTSMAVSSALVAAGCAVAASATAWPTARLDRVLRGVRRSAARTGMSVLRALTASPALRRRLLGAPGQAYTAGRVRLTRTIDWLTRATPVGEAARDEAAARAGWHLPIAIFSVALLVSSTLQDLADVRDRLGGSWWSRALTPTLSLTRGRLAWDSGNFLGIAEFGYGSDRRFAASFPGYPMLIRLVHWATGITFARAGALITMVCGLGAVLLLWHWMLVRGLSRRARIAGAWLFVLYPYSFVLFGIVYADALLVALVLVVLVLIERDRFLLAGLAGAAVTFTRPNGLAIIPALVVMALQRGSILTLAESPAVVGGSGWFPRRLATIRSALARLRWSSSAIGMRHLGVLACLGGIGAYMVWMQHARGDPIYFWSVQTTEYGHRAITSLDTWLKVEFVNSPSTFVYNAADTVNQIASALVAAVMIAMSGRAARHLGWGHAVLLWSLVAVLWVTAMGFAPAGRYLLPGIPILICLSAEWLCRRPRILRPLLVTGAIGSALLTAGFANVYLLNW